MAINAELLAEVREIIVAHPERHNQASWIGNRLANMAVLLRGRSANRRRLPVAELLPWMTRDMPGAPEDPDNPVCGTTGCVAGHIALRAAPKGSLVDDQFLYVPAGVKDRAGEPVYSAEHIGTWAAERAGLTGAQREYLFSALRTRDEVLAALEYLPAHPDATLTELAREAGDEVGEYGDYEDEDGEAASS